MALPPHWLDDFFTSSKLTTQNLAASKRFQAAVASANAAYLDTEAHIEKHGPMPGASPEQAARQAFLNSLELQVSYPE